MIQRGPESIVVFVNQPANFTCEAHDGTTNWNVNGTPVNSLSSDMRADMKPSLARNERGNTVSTLTISAKAEYNGITIQCIIFNDDNISDQSESVTLTIQGNTWQKIEVVIGSCQCFP